MYVTHRPSLETRLHPLQNFTPTQTVTSGRAAQHTLGQHKEAGPLGEIIGRTHHGRETITEGEGPTISGTLGYMLEGRDVGLEDDCKGWKMEGTRGKIHGCGRGFRGCSQSRRNRLRLSQSTEDLEEASVGQVGTR